MQCVLVVLAVALLSSAHGAHKKLMARDFPTKQLSGPPSEFASHALPTPQQAAITSTNAEYFIGFQPTSAGDFSWTQTVYADSASYFSLTVFTIVEGSEVSLTNPSGQAVDLAKHANEGYYPIGDGEEQIPAVQYTFAFPAVGAYQLTVTAPSLATAVNSSTGMHGYLVVSNSASSEIYTHFSAYDFSVNEPVGLVTRIFDPVVSGPLVEGVAPEALTDAVVSAALEAVFPDGSIVSEVMHDDGLHNDGAANDGVYGATFTATETGIYSIQAVVSGTRNNVEFVRTTQHVANVVPQELQLTGTATGSVDSSTERLNLFLAVNTDAGDLNYRPYVEVWGTDAAGAAAPACWASAIVNVQSSSSNDAVLALEVDLQWLTKAGVSAPYTLKNVFVQDIDSLVTLSQVSSIAVDLTAETVAEMEAIMASHIARGYKGEITLEMREGVSRFNNTGCSGAKLVLVHGYCTKSNPFQAYSSSFTNAVYFLQANAGVSNNQFALNILSYVNSLGLCSFGLVAHSQGGLASLHIASYYSSGLDASTGARKVQTLCSPYRGNTAMGSSSNLLSLFGSTCPTVYDMTRDGAEAWLKGITATAKAKLYFYTVQFKSVILASYCNAVTNAFLQKPNDGVVENAYLDPVGATNMGNTVGQCHALNMKYPAAFSDTARNAVLNSNAAR